MQTWLTALSLVLAFTPPSGAPAPRIEPTGPAGAAEGLFAYRFEKGNLGYSDLVTLHDGSKQLGKVMEWADQVLLYDASGRMTPLEVGQVERFEFRRAARQKTRPDLPDLTVAYVERLPRDPSWYGHVADKDGLEVPGIAMDPPSWHPATGAQVTFRIHVLNAGAAASVPVRGRALIDGAEVGAAAVPALEAGKEFVLEVAWPWQEGHHVLRVELDAGGTAPEVVRWNNTFEESTDALGIAVVVARDRYEAFPQVANVADTWCFEDWVQYQLRAMNALFSVSVYPSSPRGIEERLRCDRILVVADPFDAAGRGGWETALHRDGKPDGAAEYAALWVLGRLSEGDVMVYDALKIDWNGLRGLARSLGLVDLTRTDTTIEQCYVRDQYNRYVDRYHLFPWRRTMMYTPGGFPFDEPAAAFLNHVRGRPRGLRGDYLYQLPEKITLEVQGNDGKPLANVQVDGFQLMSEGPQAGTIGGVSRGEALYSAVTDAGGRLTLLDQAAPAHQTPAGYALRPNPFGKIAVDGSNGLLLLRLRSGDREEFHFVRLFDCNVAYLRGSTKEYILPVPTRFAAPDAPVPPLYAAVKVENRTGWHPPMQLKWPLKDLSIDLNVIEEFRVYRRQTLAGDEARPWTLLTTESKRKWEDDPRINVTYFEDFRRDVPYSLDTSFAVTTVDKLGRESRLSAPGFVAYGKDSIKLAMDTDGAYITLAGSGLCRMLWWDGKAGMQPYGVRTGDFPEYVPAFWGVTMAGSQVVVTDPVNHVLAFYDRGDLVNLVPRRTWWPGFASDEPGEFYSPLDVAADDAGNLYVADYGNDRVQILDKDGKYKALLDPEFRFVGPHALGYAYGKLCVTDKAGTRCRVYDVRTGGEPWFVRELPPLVRADRGLVSASDKVYISGRDEKAGVEGVLVYVPQGTTAVYDHVGTEAPMGRFHRPRGLYLYRGPGDPTVYFANEFPFDVGSYPMP